jgi:sarcosine oxidase subunit alpha
MDFARAGADVCLCDMRDAPDHKLIDDAKEAGVKIRLATGVLKANGRKCITSVDIARIDANGAARGLPERVPTDVLAVSGGWTPVVHLWSHMNGKPTHDPQSGAFLPSTAGTDAIAVCGTVNGARSVAEATAQGFDAGRNASEALGLTGDPGAPPDIFTSGPFWQNGFGGTTTVSPMQGHKLGKAFVDFQHDVKLSDIDQAHLEGYVSVEHLKRYTTLGMATDQGKLSNINGLERMAALQAKDIEDVGTTTFRPPYTPVTIGALVARDHGRHFRATRRSPIHDWHVENGAVMTEAGAWMRPWYFPQQGEDLSAAYKREAAHVRRDVGIVDVSTLGKIAVQGPDAAEFLNRIYVNGWKSLAVGRLRYGIMLREDGFVMDDGAMARLGEHDYFMSTTTANAAKVLAFAEHLLQTAWSDLKVHVTSVTDQWAAFAVAGPKSRDLLTKVFCCDLKRDALPNNHFTYADVQGLNVRIHRMSYSGELAYEVYVPSGHARAVWEAIIAAGPEFDLRPYGTEAMGALRIEKGHVAGSEIEGRTTLKDLGLEEFASSKKPFVGSVLRKRPVLQDDERPTLVGLEVEGEAGTKPGALLFPIAGKTEGHGDGWVSATTYSPALGKNIALALLKRGHMRKGESVRVIDFVGNQTLKATIVSHHFFDPDGERQNA